MYIRKQKKIIFINKYKIKLWIYLQMHGDKTKIRVVFLNTLFWIRSSDKLAVFCMKYTIFCWQYGIMQLLILLHLIIDTLMRKKMSRPIWTNYSSKIIYQNCSWIDSWYIPRFHSAFSVNLPYLVSRLYHVYTTKTPNLRQKRG